MERFSAVLIRHFMTRDVLCLAGATACQEALRILRARRVRRAPVVEGRELVGIVTERDLVRVLPWTVSAVDSEQGRAAAARPLREVMSHPVISVAPNDHLETAALRMLERKIGALPVVEGASTVGIVTESDVFRVFVRMATAGQGLRLTIERPERSRPRIEALAAALGLGLEVSGFFSHPAVGGRELFVLRVEGERVRELAPTLVEAGWILIDQDGEALRASA